MRAAADALRCHQLRMIIRESLAVYIAANHQGHAIQYGHGKSHVMVALKLGPDRCLHHT